MNRIPYATQWIDEEDIRAVVKALKSSNLTQGPLVDEFEKKVAEYCGAKYAVAVNSGTSALHIACLAAGISKGDEVITSPITFVASSNCVLYCGGKPIFADVRSDTINIDPQEIKKEITNKTKAIIPIHFTGNPCNLEEIRSIADENKLFVIEDASHALGAEYKRLKIGCCKYSDMTTFSFHAVKNITTGEGGIVLTNNEELRDKLIFYRSHGITRDSKYMKKSDGDWYYEMHELGFNYRITDIQCALGISQLTKIDSFVARRREIAKKYYDAFKKVQQIKLLEENVDCRSAFHLYVIQIPSRDLIFNTLREANIIVNVHYLPVYHQPYYLKLGYQSGLCPNAEEYYKKAISIPMFPKLTDEDINNISDLILNLVK